MNRPVNAQERAIAARTAATRTLDRPPRGTAPKPAPRSPDDWLALGVEPDQIAGLYGFTLGDAYADGPPATANHPTRGPNAHMTLRSDLDDYTAVVAEVHGLEALQASVARIADRHRGGAA